MRQTDNEAVAPDRIVHLRDDNPQQDGLRILDIGLQSPSPSRRPSPPKGSMVSHHVEVKNVTTVRFEQLVARPSTVASAGRWPLQRNHQQESGIPTSVCIRDPQTSDRLTPSRRTRITTVGHQIDISTLSWMETVV